MFLEYEKIIIKNNEFDLICDCSLIRKFFLLKQEKSLFYTNELYTNTLKISFQMN